MILKNAIHLYPHFTPFPSPSVLGGDVHGFQEAGHLAGLQRSFQLLYAHLGFAPGAGRAKKNAWEGDNKKACPCDIMWSYIHFLICTVTDRIMEKNVSIYRRRLSMIEKLRTFFFHNYCFHIFFHNSVGDCMSIDSQFECILRGNIEL